MISIREKAPTPKAAVEAMIRGLRSSESWDHFALDMSTFGRIKGEICFGCAATCTLIQLSEKELSEVDFKGHIINLLSSRHRAQGLGFISTDELSDFEDAIDEFRCGHVQYLGDFYGVEMPEVDELWYLDTKNWKSELPKIESYLEKL